MGSHRRLFLSFFAAFLLFFALIGFFLTRDINEDTRDDKCVDGRCRQRKHENQITIFKNEDFEITMDIEDGFPTSIGEDSPSEEEWYEIIKSLSEGTVSSYLKSNDLIVTQTQKGSYNYSYGNDGCYWSKSHGRVRRRDTKGRAASFYFQMAEGETGKPSIKYQSGFALFSDVFLSFDEGTTRWQGKEKGAFFNKNPDGSYTIFGFSSGGLAGKVTTTTQGAQIESHKFMVLNATGFIAKTVFNSSCSVKINGEEDDVTGSLTMRSEIKKKQANSGFDLEMHEGTQSQLRKSADKFIDVKAAIQGVYPKSGKGDFHTTFKAKISGSVVNSTLTTKTKGHSSFDPDGLNTVHFPGPLHTHFLI